ncbi:MAG TPA: flavin reductase family protein [Burkholderiaceae bacterium]|nr:flavin reductase family protein [Burkholderiaceae bacterium]
MSDVLEVERQAAVDPRAFREAMANHAASVAVLTVSAGEQTLGVTISSLISLSLDPPLVLFALHRHSSMLARIERGRFGITVLGESQSRIAQRLASRDRPAVPREWLHPAEAAEGAATIAGGAVRLTATLFQRWDAGDHVCIAAQVLRAQGCNRWPLMHIRSGFAALAVPIDR